MKHSPTWMIVSVVVPVVVSMTLGFAPDLDALPPAEDPEPAPLCQDSGATQESSVSSAVPVATGAQRAAIDPQTGRLLVPRRPAVDGPRPGLDAFRAPHGAFRQQRLPGGGWKLGLQGRMLNPLFAKVGPDGRLEATHAPDTVAEIHDEAHDEVQP